MNINPVVWFEIYVADMERAKAFYEAVFDTTLEALNGPMEDGEMWSFTGNMNAYGANGALVKMDHVEPGGNSTLVYFGSEDCAIEEARVADAGGTVVHSKMSIGKHGNITIVKDTEGNMIGIHSMS